LDFENVIIDKGILRSTIKFTFKSTAPPLLLIDIPKDDAEKAYRTIRDNINKAQTQALIRETTPAMIICSYCGTKNQPDASKCINCGAKLT
jgi:ribosomal protein L40E